MEKKISVIVPIYNSEKFLKKCLNSIIQQTYRNLEIILINDGSDDNSEKICKMYCGKDKRIKLINQENHGQSYSRNLGIDLSTGEYLSFVDSDDYININFYKKLVDALEQNNADVSICNYLEVKGKNQISHVDNKCSDIVVLSTKDTIRHLLKSDGINMENYLVNKLYRKEVFEGIRLPEYNIFEDLSIMYKILAKSKRTVYLKEKLYYYCIRADSSSRKLDSDFILNKLSILKERNQYISDNFTELEYEIDYNRLYYIIPDSVNISRNNDRMLYESKLFLNEYYFFRSLIFKKNYRSLFNKYSLKYKLFTIILYFNRTFFYFFISKFKY